MKTKFEVYRSAQDAAASTLGANALETAEAAITVFRAEKGDPLDWPFWKQSFDERREFFLQLQGQPSDSGKAAEMLKGDSRAPIADSRN